MADNNCRTWLRDILLGNQVRFSKPSELNDRLDLKPIYALGDWSSPEYRGKFSDWAWNSQRHVPITPPEAAFREWVLAQQEGFHQAKVEQINRENHRAIEDRWRVFSLSASCVDDLLWSRYADGHRGVALVFDASLGEFSLAFEVSYYSERQSLDITTSTLNEVLRLTILSKLDYWAYEKEFRCIGTEDEEFGTLHAPGQFFHFAPQQLLGLIMGAGISPENEALLRDWLTQREMPVQLQKAKLTLTGKLEIHNVA